MTETLVSSAWVEDHLDAVTVVDVRDEWEYDEVGHVPGAVAVPFDRIRATKHGDGEVGRLPGVEVFGELAGNAGIGTDDHVVAYDDMHGVFAARFLVTAELYGHEPARLHLLDGDFTAWSREHEVSRTASPRRSVTYPATFDEDGPLVGLEAVEEALSASETVIVDTRERHEFRNGHLPGAVRLNWRELVDADSRGMKSESVVRSLLADRKITPDQRVLLYCNTARRISHTYTILRHLEYPRVDFYEGSLTEWEREGGRLDVIDR